MADMNEQGALANAEDIIERFGGIRPMASKMAVPVTTVQGWKKRNVIPENRRGDVLNAARMNDIDLSDLVARGAVNENAGQGGDVLPRSFARYDDDIDEGGMARILPEDSDDTESLDEDDEGDDIGEDADDTAFRAPSSAPRPASFASALRDTDDATAAMASPSPSSPAFEAEPRASNRMESEADRKDKTLGKSIAASFLMIALAAAAGGAVGVAKLNEFGHRIATVETRVGALDKRLAMMEEHPATGDTGNVQQRLNGIEDQITTLSQRVQSGAPAAAETDAAAPVSASGDVTALSQRVAALEGNVAQLSGVNSLTILSDWLRQLQRSPDGQQELTAAVRDLNAALVQAQGEAGAALTNVQVQGTLGEILKTLNGGTQKAGLLLIGLADLNNARQRGAPFDEDTRLLTGLLGDAVPAPLKARLDGLSTAAKQGVPTQTQLEDQLKSLTPAINGAAAGGNAPLRDKALAKLGDLVQVSRNGQLISGTDSQAALARAEGLLEKGDVMGAVVQMRGLQGAAGVTAKPFIAAAMAKLDADRTQGELSAVAAGAIGMAGAGKAEDRPAAVSKH